MEKHIEKPRPRRRKAPRHVRPMEPRDRVVETHQDSAAGAVDTEQAFFARAIGAARRYQVG